MGKKYIAIDGDNVGSFIEYLIIKQDEVGLKAFSEKYNEAMIWLETEFLSQMLAYKIFSGGDNILLVTDNNNFSEGVVDNIRDEFAVKSQLTISIGIGTSMQQAYFALKFAKVSGKNRIINYGDIYNG